jgi:hypothetical protein
MTPNERKFTASQHRLSLEHTRSAYLYTREAMSCSAHTGNLALHAKLEAALEILDDAELLHHRRGTE